MTKPRCIQGRRHNRWPSAPKVCVLWALLLCISAAAAASPPFAFNLPPGFAAPKVPADNPISVEKVALGRLLFYDTRLSGNETQSCASCHQQALAFSDGLVVGIGSTGEPHPRNSMSLTNVAYATTLAWANPNLTALEKQVLLPMFGETPVELGLAGREDELLDRMRADGRYRRLFADAFPDQADSISVGNLVRGLTSFVRTLISGNAPYDRYVQGLDDNALSESAFLGGRLFFSERLECFHCHGGFNFSSSVTHEGQQFDDSSFFNNALYNIDGNGAYPPNNTGLFSFTQVAADMGNFKAPTLRDIALTAPYMHDGSIATLDEVLDHYAAGGRTIHSGPFAGDGSKNPYKSNFVRGFTLTGEERQQVLAFLNSLTDEQFVTNRRTSDPFAAPVCLGDCDEDDEVTVDEIIVAVNIALETAPLAGCVAADSNADGTITVNELLGAVNRLLGDCVAPATPTPTATAPGNVTPTPTPGEPPHTENILGSTEAGGGALTVDAASSVEVFFSTCLGGSGAACEGGIAVYIGTDPGFEAAEEDEPDEPLFQLLDATSVSLEVVAIDAGVRLKFDDTVLSAPGESVVLGTTPELHRDLEWQLQVPGGSAGTAHTVSLKLTTMSAVYQESAVFSVTLAPR